jgi:hypothetical protein
MKYLKLYENFTNTAESELINIVWDCINGTYSSKQLLTEAILLLQNEDSTATKTDWIDFVCGCLSQDDKKELGEFFITNYIKGDKNKYLFALIYKKLKEVDSKLAEIMNKTWELE